MRPQSDELEREITAIERHLLVEALVLEYGITNNHGSQIFSRQQLEAQLQRMLAAWYWDGRLRTMIGYKCQLGQLVKQSTKDKNVLEPEWTPEYPDTVIQHIQNAVDQFELSERKIIMLESPPKRFRKRNRADEWSAIFESSPRTYYRKLDNIKETLIAKMLTFRI